MNVKDDFLSMGSFTLQNGEGIRFWEDVWLGGIALKVKYPNIYNIVRRRNCHGSSNFQFKTA
jgi:hypothetical protein